MSAPDRSWTVAPTLLWFGALLVGGLVALDGGVQALADRLTAKREAAPAGAGPVIAARPVEVADARDDADEAAPGVPAVSPTGERTKGGALEDTCLDGTPTACKRW